MAFAFSDLVSEVKRRATKNQGGTQFDAGIKNAINTSMWRVARDAKWRVLRRTATFNTVTTYTTGTGASAVTEDSASFTVTGATFLTDNIRIGRYIKFTGSAKYFKIATITGETTGTLDRVFDGTTSTTASYSILPQEEYVLPIQIDHRSFLWHTQYGRPLQLTYMPAQEFYGKGIMDVMTNIPMSYRMWGVDCTLEPLLAASVITISSSTSADTSIAVTVFGIVSGYPDYEIITTNASDGTTTVVGSKSFSSVERITKNATTTGRITCTANSANVTVGVLPVGATTTGPFYSKVQLYPLPNVIFPINVFYYKQPYQLINDGDVPELGEDFSEAIILLATCKLKAEQNQKEDADYFKLYEDEISSLKKINVDKIDWAAELQRPNIGSGNGWGHGISPAQAGSYYGWGSW